MIIYILVLLLSVGVWALLDFQADIGRGWSVFFGVLTFLVLQGVITYFIRKRIMKDMEVVGGILKAGQQKLQEKMQRWQIRPPGSIQEAQRIVAQDTKVFVVEALAKVEVLKKYRYLVPMIERQMATAKFQLYWMIKDFAMVDKLMPKVLFVDPTMAAMKMARLYMLDKPMKEIEKCYRKAVRGMRYNQNVLLAACYSWILVKKGDCDGAFKELTEALKKSDNETLKHNHQCLMNNKVQQFNNAGLGDVWYSLMLEEPKIKMQRQRTVYR